MWILEIIGAIWEALTGVKADSKIRRVSAIISLVLLAFLFIFLLAMFVTGRLVL